MSFGCDILGCPEPAMAGSGKCKAHLRETLLARRAQKLEGEIPRNPISRHGNYWVRSRAQKLEGEIPRNPPLEKAKAMEVKMEKESTEGLDPVCPDCGRPKSALKSKWNRKRARHESCIQNARQKAKRDKKASPSPQSLPSREGLKKAPPTPKPINVTVNAGDIDPEMVAADIINHPPHYTRGRIEVIDFIEDQGLGYHDGNVVKYVCRHRHKGSPVEDLKKARWYLDRLIEREEA